MGRVGLICLVVLFILLNIWVAGAQDEEDIINSYNSLGAAFESENITAFMQYFSPEYFKNCENYTDFRNNMQYLFDNYFDIELNMEIHNITFSGDLAFVVNSGNWTGTRNDNNATGGENWLFEIDVWRKENDEWKWYGDHTRSWVRASAGHNVNPWDDHYFLSMRTRSNCNNMEMTSANVSGPGIGNMVMNPEGDAFVATITPFTPNVGDVYTFHLAYSDNFTEEVNDTIERLVEFGPNITYPQHYSHINETQPVFNWTNVSSAVGNMGYYWVRVSNGTGDTIWEIELPLTQLSVKYNIDGTAKIGLEDNHKYFLSVFVNDLYSNFAYSFVSFNVSLPVTLSGYVFDSSGAPLANIPVWLENGAELNTQTDVQGRFEFINVSKGAYEAYINENISSQSGGYTIVAFEDDNEINLTEDMEINVTLLSMNTTLELNATGILRNGDSIRANVTVVNNEAFGLLGWLALMVAEFENETYDDEIYFNSTPINLSAGGVKSNVFVMGVPENNTYSEFYIYGGAEGDWVAISSQGNISAMIYSMWIEEVSIAVLVGDVDGNCVVNIFDLAAAGLAYGSQPGDGNWNQDTDVYRDGVINIFDLATIGLNYGNTC